MLAKIKKMFGENKLGLLPLLVAIVIATLAAYFSVVGLTQIFSATVIAIILLGAGLESGKFIIVVCLHFIWEKVGLLLKVLLPLLLILLIGITAIGIFGYLSKGYGINFEKYEIRLKDIKFEELKIKKYENNKLNIGRETVDKNIDDSDKQFLEVLKRRAEIAENNIKDLKNARNNMDQESPEDVKRVQRIVTAYPDGIWKDLTQQSVEKFEKEQGRIKKEYDDAFNDSKNNNINRSRKYESNKEKLDERIKESEIKILLWQEENDEFQNEFGPISYLAKIISKYISGKGENDLETNTENMKLSLNILVSVLMFLPDSLAIVLTKLSLHILSPTEHRKSNRKKENKPIKLIIKLIKDFMNRNRYSDNRILKGKYFPSEAEINDIFIITDIKKKGMYKFNGEIWEAI